MTGAVSFMRGCGRRVQGGIYAMCDLSDRGLPLEHFIIDPPHVIDPVEMGITPVGVKLIERDGVWHVFDWVGSTHYPNVADFVEEVRWRGMSRRLPKTLDFSLLTRESRHIMIHARAWIDGIGAYLTAEVAAGAPVCPKNAIHIQCAKYWWQDVDPIRQEVAIDFDDPTEGRGPFQRVMPSFEYLAWTRPHGVTPSYSPALFMALPIHRIVVIRGADGSHEDAVEAAAKSHLPVEVEDE